MAMCEIQKNLSNFYNFIEKLEENICEKKVEQASKLASILDEAFLKSRKINDYIAWCLKCLKNNEVQKAKRHALKAKRNSIPFANDTPYNEGDDVYVIRYEHGWMDGRMKIKIIKRWQVNGIWKYKGKVYKEDEKSFEDNYFVDIDHTRDLSG